MGPTAPGIGAVNHRCGAFFGSALGGTVCTMLPARCAVVRPLARLIRGGLSWNPGRWALLFLGVSLGLGTVPVLGGCTGPVGVRGYRLVSMEDRTTLRPRFTEVAYLHEDENTADIYFTDLPRSALQPGSDLSEVSGHIVHVHMFMRPRAGRTPIDPDASTAAVTHVVIARGRVGVYQGGAFLQPSGPPGDDRWRGRIRGGTVRLEHASEGFRDQLGASQLSSSFVAANDRSTARLIERRLRELLRETPRVRERSGGANRSG